MSAAAHDPLSALTVDQVAEMLCLNDDTVRKMLATGELRGRRVGSVWRVSRQAVADWWQADGETRGRVVQLRRRAG